MGRDMCKGHVYILTGMLEGVSASERSVCMSEDARIGEHIYCVYYIVWAYMLRIKLRAARSVPRGERGDSD